MPVWYFPVMLKQQQQFNLLTGTVREVAQVLLNAVTPDQGKNILISRFFFFFFAIFSFHKIYYFLLYFA